MKKSKLWATLQALSLAVLIDCTKGLRLADCNGDHDAVELTENTSGGQTVCEDIAQDQQIEWGLGDNGQVNPIVTCNSPNQPCQNTPLLTATRNSTSSTLAVVSNATRPGAGSAWSDFDVVCRPAGGSGVSCPIDIIYPPMSSEVSCSVSTTRWNITVSCDVSKAYSARNRYNCDVRQGISTGSNGSSSYSSASSSGYASGTCNSSFPIPTSSGNYTYTVIVYPGVRTVSASPAVTVTQPSADPVVSCNDQNSYIPENTPLTCTCIASDLGQPQGRLLVYRGNDQRVHNNYGDSSVQFGESSVRRADNNTVYRCVLDWATADNQDRDTTYTLKLAFLPRLQKGTPEISRYLSYKGELVSKVFPLTVYPTIQNWTLQYLGHMSGSTAGRPARDALYMVHCTGTQSGRPYLTTCYLTIVNATQDDKGFYDLTLGNGVGQPFTFRFELGIGATDYNAFSIAVVVGLGVGVGLGGLACGATLTLVISVLRRKTKKNKNRANQGRRQDTEESDGVELEDAAKGQQPSSSQVAGLYEEVQDNPGQEPKPPQAQSISNTGDYGSLNKDDVGQKSVYSTLRPAQTSKPADDGYEVPVPRTAASARVGKK